MITAFDIYLVMQLDSIHCSLGLLLILLSLLAIPLIASFDGIFDISDEIPKKAAKVWFICFCIALCLKTLLPDSKTAAAMYVIPSIVNNQTVQKEAKDIYDLAKKAIGNLAKD